MPFKVQDVIGKKNKLSNVDADMPEIAVYIGTGRPKLGQLLQRIEYQIVGALFTPLASRKTALQ
ncbi:hypothetical protein [Glaciecola punicea]|nr:hypothetical protein [Glaciecola punicea]